MRRTKYISLIDTNHIYCDLIQNPNIFSFGIQIGSTVFKGGKRDNIFLDVELSELKQEEFEDTEK